MITESKSADIPADDVIEDILFQIDAFEEQCHQSEHTDTDCVWTLFNYIRDRLKGASEND